MAKNQDLPGCDYDNPESVVMAFITAMNAWEKESFRLHREARGSADPASYHSMVLEEMQDIFAKYCTLKERPYGRHGSFQNPPEYDPQSEKIIGSGIDPEPGKQGRAFVETEREAILGGGVYKYVLYKKSGRWLIDNLKCEVDNNWVRHIL